jgi:signal transduction histidine kinase
MASQTTSRRGLNLYIVVLTAAAFALSALLMVYKPITSPPKLILAAAFLSIIGIAGVFPIHVAPKTKVNVTTAAVFAVVLLFAPLAAIIIAGAGVAASQMFIKKKTWINRLFSVSQAVLFTGTGAMVYTSLEAVKGTPGLASGYGVYCTLVAAAAMYLVNSGAVSAAVGLQMHKNPAMIWLDGTRKSLVQELALLTIGLASALIVNEAAWAIALMMVPVVIIYYSFKNLTALNATVESQLQELKATQAQLVESARMASIGTMVAGIAHQINNPMFIIRGRAETLSEDADEQLKTPSARKAVQVILEMSDRVSRIVNSLMPDSQVSEDGASCCDVNEVMRNTLLLLEPKLLKSRVEVTSLLAEGLPASVGDACEIQEMVLNVVDNACNAMPEGGKLTLTTRETDSGIFIRVSDNGMGISPENIANVFSPYFTTRKGCGGVGLGLYVSKHIAEKNGGSITVKSRVGEGTVFTIALPGSTRKIWNFKRFQKEAMLAASGIGSPLP